MRIWTVHPQYLDTKGLLAAWREGLLAQKVLRGETRGYTRHPQLRRFQTRRFPLQAIASYLRGVAAEATRRGYQFDITKISASNTRARIVETRGQLSFEWAHLKRKLRRRAPKNYRVCCKIERPRAHPLFRIVRGMVRDWEKAPVRSRKINRVSVNSSRAHAAKRNASARS